MEERTYYVLDDILDWLGFEDKFKRGKHEYPFNQGKENVQFSWGQVLIPKDGIRETVQNKISDIKELPISEIHMMYQIPFKAVNRRDLSEGIKDWGKDISTGTINQDIDLTFRYDKQFKYGDITKSIYEVCFYILSVAKETNNFFIIGCDDIFTFMSYYVMPNQWGIGATHIESAPEQNYGRDKADRAKWRAEEQTESVAESTEGD